MFGLAFTEMVLAVITLTSLVGSIQYHAVTKAIFGPPGPTLNPKETATALRGMISIAFQLDPDTVPKLHTPLDVVRFVLSQGVGRQGLRNAVKFTPMVITHLLSIVLIPIYAYLLFIRGVDGFIPILIFMALITLKYRNKLTGPVPMPVPDNENISYLEFEEKDTSAPERAS